MNPSNQHLHILSFSINHWDHLYSLHRAIQFNRQQTGRELSIRGTIRKQPFLDNQDCSVSIQFLQTPDTPSYPGIEQDGSHRLVLGQLARQGDSLSTCISVDRPVFEELRKNLMEYCDIEGIHIVIRLGVLSPDTHWNNGETLPIVELDYAMRGDT